MVDIPKVDSYEIAGELVRKLSMEVITPLPAPGDEARALLTANSVDVPNTLEPSFQVDNKNEVVLMIRHKDMVQSEWERISKPDGDYQMDNALKDIYLDFIQNPDKYEGPNNVANRRKLFRARLADYTFNMCGG